MSDAELAIMKAQLATMRALEVMMDESRDRAMVKADLRDSICEIAGLVTIAENDTMTHARRIAHAAFAGQRRP